MNKNVVRRDNGEMLEIYREVISGASEWAKDVLSDPAYMKFLEIIEKAVTTGKRGAHISPVGEGSKRDALYAASVIITRVDPEKVSYSTLYKDSTSYKDETDGTVEHIYKTARRGTFKDKNLLIVGDPECKYDMRTIRGFMRKRANQLKKDAKEKGIETAPPRNVIYVQLKSKDKKGYDLKAASLYPFDSIPNPIFPKRPKNYS